MFIPNQSRSRPLRDEPIFVGFAGRMGSGKTTAATYLKSKYGFQYRRYSQVLQDWKAFGKVDRIRLQEAGWGIMDGGLQEELNARLIAGLDPSQSAAIDGLRHAIDFDSLLAEFGAGLAMIFLEARSEARFKRLHGRFTAFDVFEAADLHPVEGLIDSLKPRASCIVCNDASLEQLYAQLDEWINNRRIGERA